MITLKGQEQFYQDYDISLLGDGLMPQVYPILSQAMVIMFNQEHSYISVKILPN